MNATLSPAARLSNGKLTRVVATHCMDVRRAVYDTARLYSGGARALAGKLRTRDKIDGELVPMNENTFSHKINPNCFSHHVTVEEALDMMLESKDFRILYALAADCGHVAVPVTCDSSGATFEKVGAMAKEFSDVVSAVTDAKCASHPEGARVSLNEMARIEREVVELIASLNSLVANIRAQTSGVRR
jgi:predicted RNase H-like HicB family nuclease